MADLKKIVFLITDCDFGGAEQILFDLCKGLRSEFRILVLVLKSKGHFGRLIEQMGIEVKSCGLNREIGIGYLVGLFTAFFKILRELRSFRPDIVQGILFQGNLFAKLAGKLAGVNLIFCSVHTFETSRLKNIIEKLTCALARRYIVVSEALKSFYTQRVAIPLDKITVILDGIKLGTDVKDLSLLKRELKLGSGALVIGTIARLHREKGIDILIRSIPRLANEFVGLTLVVIGDGPEWKNLKKLADDLEIEDRVIFTGFLSEPEKYLPVFDLFVVPSRIEGLGVALMQAMANERPIVATNVGGIPELIENHESGLLVPPENEILMAGAISQLLHDRELAKKLAHTARDKAELEFSLEKMIKSYRGLYLDAIEGKF